MIYSQWNEQEILVKIFKKINIDKGVSLEFGGADGVRQSNTRHFANQGWYSIFLDGDPQHESVFKEFINAENINDIMEHYDVSDANLVSIDIDGNDYWVWKEMTARPEVVIIEFNPIWGTDIAKAIKYNSSHVFDRTNYFGASHRALLKLGEAKGYYHYATTRTNIIFTKEELRLKSQENKGYTCGSGWAPDKQEREWVNV